MKCRALATALWWVSRWPERRRSNGPTKLRPSRRFAAARMRHLAVVLAIGCVRNWRPLAAAGQPWAVRPRRVAKRTRSGRFVREIDAAVLASSATGGAVSVMITQTKRASCGVAPDLHAASGTVASAAA